MAEVLLTRGQGIPPGLKPRNCRETLRHGWSRALSKPPRSQNRDRGHL